MRELFIGKNADITSFFSMAYMMFFLPLCLLFYSLIPAKGKKYYLLGISILFYTLISGVMVAYLLLSIVYMFLIAKYIEKNRNKSKLLTVIFSLSHFLIFILFMTSILKIDSIYIPMGISFLTLQSVSYVVDVHRGKIKADDNIIRVALYMCFFPKIIVGPVCRYNEIAYDLYEASEIKYCNFKRGFVRIFYGLMKKLVIADRLNAFTAEILINYSEYSGGMLFLASIAYIIQIYINLSGFTDAALGSAEIFGIKLPENFNNPFFSKSCLEFWIRFEMSIGRWFRDYVYIPVFRLFKKKNVLLAWCAGSLTMWFMLSIWLGGEITSFVFGGVFFLVILFSKLLKKFLPFKPANIFLRALLQIKTIIIVIISCLVLRSDDGKFGLFIIKKMITDFSFPKWDIDLCEKIVFDYKDFIVFFAVLMVVVIVGILYEKGKNVREWLFGCSTIVRWSILYAILLITIIYGAYGKNYLSNIPFFQGF